jgi:hypothetical protein
LVGGSLIEYEAPNKEKEGIHSKGKIKEIKLCLVHFCFKK